MDTATSTLPTLRTRLTTDSADCAVSRVTVYRDRAEITRHVRLAKLAPNRTHEVILSNLPSTVDEQSVRVNGGVGHATILEVVYSQHTQVAGTTKGKNETDSEASRLNKELEELRQKLGAARDELKIVKEMEDWLSDLAKTMSSAGRQDGAGVQLTTIAAQKEFMTHFMTQRSELCAQRRTITSEIDALDKKANALQHEINRRAGRPTEIVREVTILLDVHGQVGKDKGDDAKTTEAALAAATSATVENGGVDLNFDIVYNCSNARWSARYDCRVLMQSSLAYLTYFGDVTNQTGEDWTNVKLSLSTAMPSVGGQPPDLPTAHVRQLQIALYNYDTRKLAKRKGGPVLSGAAPMAPQRFRRESAREEESDDYDGEEPPPPPPAVSVSTASVSGSTSASFTIPRNASIASDNDAHKVTITVLTLNPSLTHVVVPHLNTNVFIKATVVNESEFPLLPGPLSVYMDGSFVCTTSMASVSPREDFAIFLGVDSAVKITCTPPKILKEQVSNLLGSAKGNQETIKLETTIKNNKPTPVKMLVYDQLPLSEDSRFVVRLKEPKLPPAEPPLGWTIKLNSKNNLEWRFDLAPSKEVVVPLTYIIEYPLNVSMTIQRD